MAVVVMLLVGGLVVLGLAGLSFFWLSAPRPVMEPPRMVERVMVQPAQPVELAPELQPPTMAEAPPPDTAVRKIALKLDPQGKILADGQSVDIGGLKNLLVKTHEDGTIRLEVVVEVDRQCMFEHVAAVQAICKEIGVENVRVQALTASPD
ncbi:MAG: biopolymer transporter ExbD [Planctomycetota bacterium]|nr:biopolymer transporter ExbD [Planctomycetota bacterium]